MYEIVYIYSMKNSLKSIFKALAILKLKSLITLYRKVT